MEVTVSPDPDDPHSVGAVSLVRDGCRNRDFASIIPHQPARYRDRPNEVFLDFEAFLLSSMKERSTLWIHSQVSLYSDEVLHKSSHEFMFLYRLKHVWMQLIVNLISVLICLIKTEILLNVSFYKLYYIVLLNALITGHGRKRRAIEHDTNTTEYTKFKENLQYTVLMPGELTNEVKYKESGDQCRNFVMISGLLAGLLALSTIIVRSELLQTLVSFLSKPSFLLQTCGLASKLQSSGRKSLDDFVKSGYAGRAVMQ